MVTFFKTLDETNLIRVSKKRGLKFNRLLTSCIGKAAAPIRAFYLPPVGARLMRCDTLAVNTIVKNRKGEASSCDVHFTKDLSVYNQEYFSCAARAAADCQDRDLAEECRVIDASAIIDTEIDGAAGMNSGIFNNPFMIWGRYRRRALRRVLTVSFQFHHPQRNGAHAGRSGQSAAGNLFAALMKSSAVKKRNKGFAGEPLRTLHRHGGSPPLLPFASVGAFNALRPKGCACRRQAGRLAHRTKAGALLAAPAKRSTLFAVIPASPLLKMGFFTASSRANKRLK